jgi:hypothetical protein
LRRLVIIGTALAVLVGAAAAYAAFNNYTGSALTFGPKGVGTVKRPKAVNMTEHLVANAPAGDRAAPLTDVKLTVFGVKTNGGMFPACSDAQIEANKLLFEKACPKGSLISQGPVHSLLGPGSDPSLGKGTPCNPFLKVFNGGQGTQVLFFTTAPDAAPQYKCAGLPTGATAPYDGHITQRGSTWTLDTPLPPDISNKVANQPGLYGSLITETLFPVSETKKVHGRKRAYMESIACKHGKRAWSITYTAADYNTGTLRTQTVSGTAGC